MVLLQIKLITDKPVTPRPYIQLGFKLRMLSLRLEFIYLNFNVANPINARIIDIIQNLITTVDSAHPFFSK